MRKDNELLQAAKPRVWASESAVEIRHVVSFLIFAAAMISMPWYVSHIVAWMR